MSNVAIITVEKQHGGKWFARFAESNRFYGEAERSEAAINRLIDSFGQDKIVSDEFIEVKGSKRHDYQAFIAPLNALGKTELTVDAW